MEYYTEKNVDQIIDKVENLFTTKIGPYIEKTVQEQKDSLVKDILAQVKTNFLKELNISNMKKEESPKIDTRKSDDGRTILYELHDLEKYGYNYNNMKNMMVTFNKFIDDTCKGNMIKNADGSPDFLSTLKTGEYLVFVYCKLAYDKRKIEELIFVTNFGSVLTYVNNYQEGFMGDFEIPSGLLITYLALALRCKVEKFDINTFKMKDFNLIMMVGCVCSFQEYQLSIPLTGHTIDLFKKENDSLKIQIEEMKREHEKIREEQNKKLEESRLEQERIKHMYGTLELKDQYHKAVELLRQNKVERDLIDQDRRKFHAEKVESEIEIEEKNKKYRQIKDIDTEISRLALMKQKLEKDRKEFEKEREEFEDLRNKLMDD